MTSLEGQVVWLTGASSGIGRYLALELGRRGSKVALTARRADALEEIVTEIRNGGGQAQAFPGDVVDQARMEEIAKEIESALGPIDVLIANAGTHIFTKPHEFSSAEYMDLMNINFGGQLHCFQAVLPSMYARRKGRIVGMASLAGYRGLPRAAAYGASKAAIIHFLESLRFHLKDQGVDVTIVNPGFVKTPLTDKNDFSMPFLVEPERAANIICDGIEKGRKEISFPIPFNWLLKLMRIIPYPIYERLVYPIWRAQGSK